MDSCCSPLARLPLLCQCRILQFCAPRDIRSARLVCRALRDASTRVRWKVRFVRNKQQYAERLTPEVLGNLHTLLMNWSTDVTDVSALRGIHTLWMLGCTAVRDVSPLAGIHTLLMAGCNAVRDVSALAGIYYLDMRGCTGVQDVSALAGIPILRITRDQLSSTRGLDILRKSGSQICASSS